jgi:hypothetical protein
MILRISLLGILILSFVLSLFAKEPTEPTQFLNRSAVLKVLGGGNYGAETLESLQISGLAKLHGTTITDLLQVTGSLISLYAHLNTVDITGEANFTDTHVEKEATIIGSIQAVSSTFHQHLNLLTQKAVFTHCKLKSISIRQDSAFKGKQLLELKQGTIVNGSITFEGGKGEILLYPGSQILGTVTGGKVVRK